MDGYAVAVSENFNGNCFQIIERLRPQDTPLNSLNPGQAAGMVTGGPLPDGTVAVMPQELAKVDENNVIFAGKIEAGSNIKPQGEDYQAGDMLVKRGTALNPGLISALAQKSSMFRPAANCNALIDLPAGQQPLRNEQTVKAILLGPYSSLDYSGIM